MSLHEEFEELANAVAAHAEEVAAKMDAHYLSELAVNEDTILELIPGMEEDGGPGLRIQDHADEELHGDLTGGLLETEDDQSIATQDLLDYANFASKIEKSLDEAIAKQKEKLSDAIAKMKKLS